MPVRPAARPQGPRCHSCGATAHVEKCRVSLLDPLFEAVRKTQVRAILDDCVFDLAGGGAALFRLANTASIGRRVPAFVITGSGSVIRPEIPVVAWSNGQSAGRSARAFDTVVEGLAVGDFRFAGPSGLSASSSVVVGQSLEIPRCSDVPPGIVPDRLAFAELRESRQRQFKARFAAAARKLSPGACPTQH